MELETLRPAASTRRANRWLQITLLIGFVFCLIIGIGALAALFFMRSAPPPPSRGPLPSLPAADITPAYALAQLAGDDPRGLAYQALQAGELDLANQITYFSVSLTDDDRLALWLQIARRYARAGRVDEARQAYEFARTVVVLGPSLSFAERSQALLQIIEDALTDLDDTEMARDTVIQLTRLISQTPDILPAQRSQILENLRHPAQSLEDETLRADIDALARNPYITPPGRLLVTQWARLGGPLPPDTEAATATAQRQQAARALMERLRFTGGVDIDPERQALAAALIREDQVRAAAFQRIVAGGLPLPQQVTLFQERRAWIALKLQIATGAYGLSIAPEWEANLAGLQQELAAANNNLLAVIEALTLALSDPIAQAMLRVESQTWVAQQAELGLVADRAPVDLSDQLRFLQSEAARLGAPLALPIGLDATAIPPGFRLLPTNAQ